MKTGLAALVLLAAVGAVAAEVEPHVRRVIIEDDQVRIEELRVRGQVQQVIVRQKKGPAPEYQIIVPRGGRDAARDRDAAGQRVWQILSF